MRKIAVASWIFFYLVLIDIIVNIVFKYPENPQDINPSRLQIYFEYGRSVEGKLERMTGRSDEKSAPIISHGWLLSKKYEALPVKPKTKGTSLVAVYGMSHTGLLGKAIVKSDNRYVIRNITAPGAPPNWSFGAYEFDIKRHSADVVILGIMTDNVASISATTGGTYYFDMSYPYTFPRYLIHGGELRGKLPPFYSIEGYRKYFYDEQKWYEYTMWLKQNDDYFRPQLYNRSVFDKSALIRILRRSYAQKIKQRKADSVYSSDGFVESSEEVQVLKAIVRMFARIARKNDSIPIIYIVNNQNRSDHLYRVLKPVLDEDMIPHLSTHIICPPDNPRVFLSENSHFIPSKDLELAREIIKIIENERSR